LPQDVCSAWRIQLEGVCKGTKWRGEERTREEQRERKQAAGDYSDRPAGGQLEAVAAEAAREAAWTSEADEEFKKKFKEAQAKPEYGWGAADLLAVRSELGSIHPLYSIVLAPHWLTDFLLKMRSIATSIRRKRLRAALVP
jgi:hypothetical protein